MRPTLSVLIVAWDSRDDLNKTLPPLLAELDEGDELIVVENKAGDGSVEVTRELAPRARIVRTGRNTGFAGGINAGAKEARGDLLVMLNPDAAPRFGKEMYVAGRPRRAGRTFLAGAGLESFWRTAPGCWRTGEVDL